jgi:hypothetical protein
MKPHQLHGCSFGTAFRKINRCSLTAERGRVNRQPAPVIGEWTSTGYWLATPGDSPLTVPEHIATIFSALPLGRRRAVPGLGTRAAVIIHHLVDEDEAGCMARRRRAPEYGRRSGGVETIIE